VEAVEDQDLHRHIRHATSIRTRTLPEITFRPRIREETPVARLCEQKVSRGSLGEGGQLCFSQTPGKPRFGKAIHSKPPFPLQSERRAARNGQFVAVKLECNVRF
jgi:hypothetical protein